MTAPRSPNSRLTLPHGGAGSKDGIDNIRQEAVPPQVGLGGPSVRWPNRQSGSSVGVARPSRGRPARAVQPGVWPVRKGACPSPGAPVTRCTRHAMHPSGGRSVTWPIRHMTDLAPCPPSTLPVCHLARLSPGPSVTWPVRHLARPSPGPSVTWPIRHLAHPSPGPSVTWPIRHLGRPSPGPSVTWAVRHLAHPFRAAPVSQPILQVEQRSTIRNGT
jgi:hypothetical protein